MSSCCFVGRGKLYLGDAVPQNGNGTLVGWGANYGAHYGGLVQVGNDVRLSSLRFVGNVKSLEIQPSYTTYEQQSYTGDGSGECGTNVLNSVDVTAVFTCAELQNMLMFMDANVSSASGGAVVEQHQSMSYDSGTSVFVDGVIDESQPVTLSFYDGVTAIVLGASDYEVEDCFAITLKNSLTAINQNAYIEIAYQSLDYRTLDAYQNNRQAFSMRFDGINLFDDKRHLVSMYHARITSYPSIQEISDAASEYQVTFRLIPVKINGKFKRLTIKEVNA